MEELTEQSDRQIVCFNYLLICSTQKLMQLVQIIKNDSLEKLQITHQKEITRLQVGGKELIAYPIEYILEKSDQLPQKIIKIIHSFLRVSIKVEASRSAGRIKLDFGIQNWINMMVPLKTFSLADQVDIKTFFFGRFKQLLKKFQNEGEVRSPTQRFLDLHFYHLRKLKQFEFKTNPVHPNLLQELLDDKVRFNDLDEELKYELDSFVEDMYDSDVLLFKLQSNDDQNQSLPFDYGLFFGYPWQNHPQILTIGRLYLSTICLLNNKISKNHAYISYQTIPNNPNKKAFFIFDGDQQTPSTNTTFLRITRPIEIIQKTIILFENTTIMIDPTQLNRQQQTSRLRKSFEILKYLN